MSLPPAIGRLIAFAVAAAVFVGIMGFAAIFIAAPLREWYGDVAQGWPAWAHLLFIFGGIAGCYSLGFYLKRRDQRRAERATL